MPLPRIPQRGDKIRLQQLASGVKLQNGTSGPQVQRNPVGRPPGSTTAPTATTPAPQVQIPEKERQALQDAAKVTATYVFWSQVTASQGAGPWASWMVEASRREAESKLPQVYDSTPNFE